MVGKLNVRGKRAQALANPEAPFEISVEQPKYWVYLDPSWDWHSLTYENYQAFFDKTIAMVEKVIGTVSRTNVPEDLGCLCRSDESSCGQDGLGQEVSAGARAEGRDHLPGQCDALQLPLGALGVPEPRPVGVHALVS